MKLEFLATECCQSPKVRERRTKTQPRVFGVQLIFTCLNYQETTNLLVVELLNRDWAEVAVADSA